MVAGALAGMQQQQVQQLPRERMQRAAVTMQQQEQQQVVVGMHLHTQGQAGVSHMRVVAEAVGGSIQGLLPSCRAGVAAGAGSTRLPMLLLQCKVRSRSRQLQQLLKRH